MDRIRYVRMLVLGGIVFALSLPTWHALTRDVIDEEETPIEAALEKAAGAPEVGAQDGRSTEWDLPATRNARVDYWIDFLKGRNKDRTRLWLERMGRYEEFIRGKLRERGMPEDLIYLALIESGFSPVARSHASAVGLWQFIAETGRRYGLEITGYVDERRDPIKATDAALDYLSDLYRRFGSWYLAAAAYNTGENRVERLLRRYAGGARGDDDLFWKIDQYLPRETRDYVPLMLAAGFIAKDPERYGFKDLKPHAPLRFASVRVPGGTSLRTVARAAQVDESEIKGLNPHFVRGVTPPGRESIVRIPAGREPYFAVNFPRIRQEERLAGVQHTVRRGETLSHIARRYGTTVEALRAANGGINPRRLQVGQRLYIPGGDGVRLASAASTRAGTGKAWQTYRVQRGDSLWKISRRYGVTVRQLQEWNGLGRRSKIIPGQTLRIRT